MSETKEVVLVEMKQPKEEVSPIVEEMVRGEEKVKKCCAVMKEDVHIAGKCCAYTWCCTLNGIECCCVSMSKLCLAMSEAAMGCNKLLEQIDCDKH